MYEQYFQELECILNEKIRQKYFETHKKIYQSSESTCSTYYAEGVNSVLHNVKADDRSIFFPIWVFFHEESLFTGQLGKSEAISLTSLFHFHQLHRHLDISQAITAGSSPLNIASSRSRTWNLWFPSGGC